MAVESVLRELVSAKHRAPLARRLNPQPDSLSDNAVGDPISLTFFARTHLTPQRLTLLRA